MTTSTSTAYYHRDRVGSIVNLTNGAGTTLYTNSYLPYGAEASSTKASGAPVNYMLFAGQYRDKDTGLLNLRARQYDATTGRFTSTDPVNRDMLMPYLSSYLYAEGRPLLLTDPTGLCFWCIDSVVAINYGASLFATGAAAVSATAGVATFAGCGPVCAGVAAYAGVGAAVSGGVASATGVVLTGYSATHGGDTACWAIDTLLGVAGRQLGKAVGRQVFKSSAGMGLGRADRRRLAGGYGFVTGTLGTSFAPNDCATNGPTRK